jgi:molybdate transport system substrate-binding protein
LTRPASGAIEAGSDVPNTAVALPLARILDVRVRFLLLVFVALPLAAADGITIFAAASTSDVVQVVANQYEADRGVHVTCSFASSSTLAKQIENGAPADLFLSADQKWMDYLANKRAVVLDSRLDLVANSLVLVVPMGTSPTIRVEKGFAIASAFTGRLAIGDPTNVPAGVYAKEAFTALGWWEVLSTRLAPAADVRAALKLVELGEAELGIVYATDAKVSAKVSVAATIPASLHSPIRYPIALTTTAKPAAASFLAYLQSEAGRAAFVQAGFTIPTVAEKPLVTP